MNIIQRKNRLGHVSKIIITAYNVFQLRMYFDQKGLGTLF